MSQEVSNQEQQLSTLPDLSKKKPSSIPMNPVYWTPETEGESKDVFVLGKTKSLVPSINNPEEKVELECINFVEPDYETGDYTVIQNGGAILVSTITAGVQTGAIITIGEKDEEGNALEPTGLRITYRGKVKNKGNQFSSDDFEIRQLV